MPVSGAEAVVEDSLIYILGGYSDSLRSNVDFIQEYNPRQNTWRLYPGNLRQKREGFVTTAYKDSLILLGGTTSSSAGRHQMEIWNPGSGSPAVYRVNTNFNRTYATAHTFGDRLLLFGGLFNNSTTDTSLHYLVEYSLSAGVVTYRYDSTFTQFRQPALQMSELVDSSIYLFGGIYDRPLTTIFRYDIKTRKFTRLSAQLPRSRAGGEIVELRPRTFMIIGGYSDQRALNTVELCTINNPNTPVFTSAPAMVNPRWDFAACLFEKNVYVFGGEELFGNTNPVVEKLDVSTIIGIRETPETPAAFTLLGNYPNPFNPSTSIKFILPARMELKIEVYDIQGRLIKELVSEEFDAGEQSVHWDGTNTAGLRQSSGVYFYRIGFAGGFTTGKMMLLQ